MKVTIRVCWLLVAIALIGGKVNSRLSSSSNALKDGKDGSHNDSINISNLIGQDFVMTSNAGKKIRGWQGEALSSSSHDDDNDMTISHGRLLKPTKEQFVCEDKYVCGEPNGEKKYLVSKLDNKGVCQSKCMKSTADKFEKKNYVCGGCDDNGSADSPSEDVSSSEDGSDDESSSSDSSSDDSATICDDADLCTNDSFDGSSGECVFTPIDCGDLLCDSFSGACVEPDEIVPCVAVIDEWDSRDYTTTWQQFRDQFPRRPFCLLVPETIVDFLPVGFEDDSYGNVDGIDRTIVAIVNRDEGSPALVSDWFNICQLENLSPSSIQFVGLFVDDSGSMRVGTVQASLDAFEAELASRGIEIGRVFNGLEQWIDPFITTLAPKNPTSSPTTLSPTTSMPTTLSLSPAPTTSSPTSFPTTETPTVSPSTSSPTLSPTTLNPTESPITTSPTVSPSTLSPTGLPTTTSPTESPITTSPTMSPTTLSPTGLPTTTSPSVPPTSTAKQCDSSLGSLSFAGLTSIVSFRRGEASVDWNSAEAVALEVEEGGEPDKFGCDSISYSVLFKPIDSLDTFVPDDRSIEVRLDDPSIVVVTTNETSVTLGTLAAGQAYAVVVVAVGDGVLFSPVTDEALVIVSQVDPVLDPAITWIGVLDIDALFGDVSSTYNTESSVLSISIVNNPTSSPFPFELESLAIGDTFAVKQFDKISYFEVTVLNSINPTAAVLTVNTRSIDELFQDVDISLVYDIVDAEADGDNTGGTIPARSRRTQEVGKNNKVTMNVPTLIGLEEDASVVEVPTLFVDEDGPDTRKLQTDENIESFERSLKFFQKFRLTPNATNGQGNGELTVDVTPSFEFKAFTVIRIGPVKKEVFVKYGSSLSLKLDILGTGKIKTTDPVIKNFIDRVLLPFRFFIPIPLAPLPLFIPISGDIRFLAQFQLQYDVSLTGGIKLDFVGFDASKTERVIYDRTTGTGSREENPLKITPFDLKYDIGVDFLAGFSAGVAVVLRTTIDGAPFKDFGIDLTYGEYGRATLEVGTPNTFDVIDAFDDFPPLFLNQFKFGIESFANIRGFIGDANSPDSTRFTLGPFPANPINELLKLPSVFPDADFPYSLDTCNPTEPTYSVVNVPSFPADWGPVVIDGFETMTGPYRFVQKGDWGDFDALGTGTTVTALPDHPRFALPKDKRNDDGVWVLEEDAQFAYLLLGYMQAFPPPVGLPFVLGFAYLNEDADALAAGISTQYDFRCCDASDCISLYPDDYFKSTCGRFASGQEGQLYGDCVAPCVEPSCSSIGCLTGTSCAFVPCTDSNLEPINIFGQQCVTDILL